MSERERLVKLIKTHIKIEEEHVKQLTEMEETIGYAAAKLLLLEMKLDSQKHAGILNGILDISGNALYVLAARTGRLDVAAVLGALYPASTVLLAWVFLKERISPIQTAGIVLAFAAIILFTL